MQSLERNVNLSGIKSQLQQRERKLFARRVFSNRLIVTGGVITVFLVLVALLGPSLVPFGPYEMEPANRLQEPSAVHLLGTDNLGRDLLARVVYGAQTTIEVGLITALICSILGMLIGLYASYYRALDHILMRICDGLMAIPAILLAIALMAAMGPSMMNVVIALSIVLTPAVVRVIRADAMKVREQTYIEAMKALGASPTRIIWLHIMPNTVSSLVVQATFVFAEVILTEAALSFLGAGVPAPAPSWGNILYDGKLVIYNAWWMTVFPGAMIFLSVLGLNILGDGLRDLIDPHAKRAK